jgi:hypothetical protein
VSSPAAQDSFRVTNEKELMMTLPVRWITREEMLSSFVARFNDLKGSDKGLPDSDVPGHYKVILNVFGFDPPFGKGVAAPSSQN